MALFHKVAGNLSVVLHGLLREEIRREGFLDSCHPGVLLISDNAVDSGGIPLGSPRDRQDAPLGQFLGDGAWCQPLDEQPEDEPHGLGPLFLTASVSFWFTT